MLTGFAAFDAIRTYFSPASAMSCGNSYRRFIGRIDYYSAQIDARFRDGGGNSSYFFRRNGSGPA
jgi:hypothetical protein